MRDQIRIVAVAVSILVASSTAARAGNVCITEGANMVLAGRKFTLPGKDKCKAITGFNLFDLCSGVACTSADGTLVRVHYTCSEDQIIVLKSFYYGFPLPLPSSNVGNATYSAVDNGTPVGTSFPPGTFQLGPCAKPFLAVPN